MPLHGRTIKFVVDKGVRFLTHERKFWQGLYGPSGRYPGVSNYKQAAKGIQHGLAGGATIGSLIGNGGDESGNGSIQQGNGSKTGPQDKTRNRRKWSSNNYSKRCRPYNNRGHSRYNKSYSMRNR